ncbi:hypothetical protein KIN20_038018 [Parelaphostrongylus tenuis]|uniref:Kinesin-like protein n=1 Tax=Parelaphostrongylus tenuis TaxID=148309 RepID=A0AAD5REP7_PARTN|nr:hypothetical protein KIN20_038018 [Parelaphostrongylus tenuis]
MENVRASNSKDDVLSSTRSGIPRAAAVKARPPVPSAVQAARNLKRRSIEQLRSSALPAKRIGLAPTTSARSSVNQPLPMSMARGRVTLASVGNQPRYLQSTAAAIRRTSTTSGPQQSTLVRRSPSVGRESQETRELRKKVTEQEAELMRVRAELEITKSQLQLKDQNLVVLQTSLETFQQTLALKDGQMNAIQTALDAERGKSGIMQLTLDSQKEEIIRLKSELSERLENIGRLTSELAAKRDELRDKDEEIRDLHNAVVDLRGQIRVAVRVRPPLGKELEMPINHLSYPGVSSVKLDQAKGSQTFEFQRVFGPNMSQARVFSDVQELIMSCLHGYNVSIIAYGQTGSGKTHTMRGGEGESEGLIPRAVKFLFQSKHKLSDLDWTFEFKASFLEVYNEEVFDLLAERNKLELKMGSGNTTIHGLKCYDINNTDDVENILLVADRTRSTAATKCNEQSSRSHAVFKLSIEGHNKTSRATRHASLHLVDLAGSERVKDSGAEGDRFKEMTFINSALSNLQNCIRSQLNKNQHIPYRDSKLTMILRDSLGAGNSKTMVIVALNPALAQIAETKRSLEFAQQMSMTKIGTAKKQEQ